MKVSWRMAAFPFANVTIKDDYAVVLGLVEKADGVPAVRLTNFLDKIDDFRIVVIERLGTVRIMEQPRHDGDLLPNLSIFAPSFWHTSQ
jgi:hypothetical protein